MHQANDLSPPHLNTVVACLNMQDKMATNKKSMESKTLLL